MVGVMPGSKQHVFTITHQHLELKSRGATGQRLEEMELVPPTSSPGPWEVVSWNYDPAMAGGLHIVWRHE